MLSILTIAVTVSALVAAQLLQRHRVRVASTLQATSREREAAVLLRQGRYDEAAQLLERVVAFRERELSYVATELCEPLYLLGVAYGELGRAKEAVPLLERAFGIAAYAPGFPSRGTILVTLGNALARAGDEAAALQAFRRGLAVGEVDLEHEAYLHEAIGFLHEQSNDLAAADLAYATAADRLAGVRALQGTSAPRPPNSPYRMPHSATAPAADRLAGQRFGIPERRAILAHKRGDLVRAEASYGDAMAALEDEGADARIDLARVLRGLAGVLLAQDRVAASRDAAARALAVLESHPEAALGNVGAVQLLLARGAVVVTLCEANEVTAARERADAALADFDRASAGGDEVLCYLVSCKALCELAAEEPSTAQATLEGGLDRLSRGSGEVERASVGVLLSLQAFARTELGRPGDAEEPLAEGLAISGRGPLNATTALQHAALLDTRAEAARLGARLDAAITDADDAVAMARAIFPGALSEGVFRATRARILRDLGRAADAAAEHAAAREMVERSRGRGWRLAKIDRKFASR